MKKYVIGGIAVVVVIILALVISTPKAPFETIERAYSAGTDEYWISSDPGLQVFVNDYDVATSYLSISDDARAELLDINFDKYIVIIAHAGYQTSGHEGIEIERIERKDNQIRIYAFLGNPTGEDRICSPYHIVTFRKRGTWDQTFDFILYLNGQQSIVVSKQIS